MLIWKKKGKEMNSWEETISKKKGRKGLFTPSSWGPAREMTHFLRCVISLEFSGSGEISILSFG